MCAYVARPAKRSKRARVSKFFPSQVSPQTLALDQVVHLSRNPRAIRTPPIVATEHDQRARLDHFFLVDNFFLQSKQQQRDRPSVCRGPQTPASRQPQRGSRPPPHHRERAARRPPSLFLANFQFAGIRRLQRRADAIADRNNSDFAGRTLPERQADLKARTSIAPSLKPIARVSPSQSKETPPLLAIA